MINWQKYLTHDLFLQFLLSMLILGSFKGSLFGGMQSIMGIDFDIKDEKALAACNDNAIYVWSVSTRRLQVSIFEDCHSACITTSSCL
jgi:hypothetical protein